MMILSLCGMNVIQAFNPDAYAPSSVLSRGRWVKLSVAETGMHRISLSDLKAWGFDDPSKVRIYGYGGNRIPDYMSRGNYIDDLPMVQSEMTPRGLVFYAVGPLTRHDEEDGTHYHTANPYSTHGYYFISDREPHDSRDIITEGTPGASGTPATTFMASVRHESDLENPTQSGHMMLGEDFRFTPTRQFTFSLPGRIEDSTVKMRCSFSAKSSGGVQLTFACNGKTLTPSTADRIPATSDLGASVTARREFDMSGENLRLSITAGPSGTVTYSRLDNITLCYERSIAMPASGVLDFTADNTSVSLTGASSRTTIWDVTDPLNIFRVANSTVQSDGTSWTNDYYGHRHYAAWNIDASLPSPRVAEVLRNQDIHSQPVPDMVIISPAKLRNQAERLATLHAGNHNPLRVYVVSPEEIANEFGSGCCDINAMRRMLKMFHDRGTDGDGHRLQYALLMGSVHYDHRKLSAYRSTGHITVPTWQTDNSTEENFSFSSDDALGILGDNTGLHLEAENMDIAVGRIPAHTESEARVFVDRLISYVKSPRSGQWRNRIMLVADDGNNNIHMTQTEDMEASFRSFPKGRDMTYSKVYVDTYDKIGGVVQLARDKFYNLLNDGVVWWNYVGHSSITTMGAEGLLDLTDINNMYLRHAPFYYGATCSFVHWDGDEYSGLEMLTLSESGGVIGGISATRSVYITRNGILTVALGKELFDTDSNGMMRPIGEVLRRSKNRIGADSNKLRYVLLGDPAMRIAFPDNIATLDSINGSVVVPDDGSADPLVISALGTTVLKGSICSATGTPLDSFNGYIDLTLYDAERSFTTQGRESDETMVYEEQGDRLYSGRAKVTAGKWECSLILPPEIADNFRNATLSMYAQSDDESLSAVGVNREFYVYGYDENAVIDEQSPVIEAMYLNHESFRNGDAVNPSPMLIARVSDDTGLNMSLSGIGHQMTVRIDNDLSFNDVSSSFIPASDGSPSGDIAYQLPELTAGNHTATLRVWDIGGNSATASVDFYVDPMQSPKIFDVYTDANPATTEANFYIVHNRPDAMLSVRIDIYDISGRLVWSDTTRGRADMYTTTPVKWDLTHSGGSRVGRGIYVYRATVITEDSSASPSTSSSVAKRIAVSSN